MADPPNLIQQLDSWQGIFIGCCAALAALLVPLTGFLKTFLDYRVESKKAEMQLKPEVARDVAQAGGSGVLFDSIAVADLTAAIKELTGAIRADTASDEAQHASQFAQVLTRLTTVLDRHDDDHGPPPRRTR